MDASVRAFPIALISIFSSLLSVTTKSKKNAKYHLHTPGALQPGKGEEKKK